MYEIKITDKFCGAHNLREYEGKCENLHGHNWKVEVCFRKNDLDKTGMVIDFRTAKSTLKLILEKLDHTYINEISFFKHNNPTSENMARYIFDAVFEHDSTVSSVTVWETDTSSATYFL